MLAHCPRCQSHARALGFSKARLRRYACTSCNHEFQDPNSCLALITSDLATARVWGVSSADAEAVETIAMMYGADPRQIVPIDTTISELERTHGPASARLSGFCFPAYRWEFEEMARGSSHFVVIDQGERRFSFYTRPAEGGRDGGRT